MTTGAYRQQAKADPFAAFKDIRKVPASRFDRILLVAAIVWIFYCLLPVLAMSSGELGTGGGLFLASDLYLAFAPLIAGGLLPQRRLFKRARKAQARAIAELAPGQLVRVRGKIAPGERGTVRSLQTQDECVWTRTNISDPEINSDEDSTIFVMQAAVDFHLVDCQGEYVHISVDDRTEWRAPWETHFLGDVTDISRLHEFFVSRSRYPKRYEIGGPKRIVYTTPTCPVSTREKHLKPGDEVMVVGNVERTGEGLGIRGADGPLIVAKGPPYSKVAVAFYRAAIFLSVAALLGIVAALLGYGGGVRWTR